MTSSQAVGIETTRLGMKPPPNTGTKSWEGRERIMDDLTELYSCRPTRAVFRRAWHPDAVFEGPLVKAKGRTQYEAQWYAMPWLFSDSRLISKRVILSTDTPNRLVYVQVQEYTILERKQRLESVVDLELDGSDRITRMVDRWNGEALPTGFWAEWLRWLNACIMPWIVRIPEA